MQQTTALNIYEKVLQYINVIKIGTLASTSYLAKAAYVTILHDANFFAICCITHSPM